MRAPAAATAAASASSSGLAGTAARGSALRRDSSLSGRKRLKRSCQASSRRRASATAAAAPAPPARTSQAPPKQAKRSTAALMACAAGAGCALSRDREQRERGQDGRGGGGEEPRRARVRALHQAVQDAQQPRERGPAVQPAPARRPDAPARVVGEPEQHEQPAGDDARRRPQRLVAADERDRHVGQARAEVAVAEQRAGVHDQRGDRRQRQRLVRELQLRASGRASSARPSAGRG